MNPADEEAAKLVPTEGQSPGAAVGSHDNLEEQLHNLEEQLHDATLKDLQRTSHQSKPAEDLHGSDDKVDEEFRFSVETLRHPSPPPIPVQELDDLLLGITHHLDDETSERKAIHNRLRAIENEMERLASRGFHFLLAICIGVAAILAWQSYGEATKQIIATRAPELGWSPEAKQMIASWVQHLGWTKPLPGPEKQAAPVAQKAPATLSLDPEQMQQLTRSLTLLQQTVEQLAATQDQMAREITRLQAADQEILAKITPAPPPQPPAAPARKPTQTTPPSSRAPIPPRPPPHP